MNTAWLAVLVFICVGVGLWLASLLLETLRRAPEAPTALSWAPDIAIDYLTVNGNRLRYIRTGRSNCRPSPYPAHPTRPVREDRA
jgi:hypothetical protein